MVNAITMVIKITDYAAAPPRSKPINPSLNSLYTKMVVDWAGPPLSLCARPQMGRPINRRRCNQGEGDRLQTDKKEEKIITNLLPRSREDDHGIFATEEVVPAISQTLEKIGENTNGRIAHQKPRNASQAGTTA